MFDFCKRHLPLSDSNLKVLKQDDKTIEGAMFVRKSSCHFGKPYLSKHKNNKQTRTKKN